MNITSKKIIKGYHCFRKKYAVGAHSLMEQLGVHGQNPDIMVVACCDSRVDPALIFQTDPGDLFIARNISAIIPPYQSDNKPSEIIAALEFGICSLKVKHLIILGHSQCGGIKALIDQTSLTQDDFIGNWVDTMKSSVHSTNVNEAAQQSILQSYRNCLSFPWIKERFDKEKLHIHPWFFDIEKAEIAACSLKDNTLMPISDDSMSIIF